MTRLNSLMRFKLSSGYVPFQASFVLFTVRCPRSENQGQCGASRTPLLPCPTLPASCTRLRSCLKYLLCLLFIVSYRYTTKSTAPKAPVFLANHRHQLLPIVAKMPIPVEMRNGTKTFVVLGTPSFPPYSLPSLYASYSALLTYSELLTNTL